MSRPDILKKLDSAARQVIQTDDFLSGEWGPDECQGRLQEWVKEAEGLHVDLTEFHDAVTRCTSGAGDRPSSTDASLAEALHHALPLSRRDASDFGYWRFLTACTRRDYVFYRWENDGRVNEDRFLGSMARRSRWYRNALARLWWGTELTVEDGEYALTHLLFSNQDLVETFFGSTMFYHPPAARAFLKCMEEAGGTEAWRGVPEQLSSMLSLRVLETMTEAEVRARIEDILEQSGDEDAE